MSQGRRPCGVPFTGHYRLRARRPSGFPGPRSPQVNHTAPELTSYAVAVDAGRVWRLYHRGELVGEIDEQSRDFPWTYGRLRPLPGFAPLRPLFDAWNAALDADDDETMKRIDDDIRAALTMTRPDGHHVAEFLLTIEDDEAGFRWLDESVEDGPAGPPAGQSRACR